MSETLIQSIRDEFEQFSFYKEQYDYICGSPLVKKLFKEISILEKQNQKMISFVLEQINEISSQKMQRKSNTKLTPLRKKPAQNKKYCETQTKPVFSNMREPLKRPIVYIKEEPNTKKSLTILKHEKRIKSKSQPDVIVNDISNDISVLNNNIKLEILDKIIQETVVDDVEKVAMVIEDAVEENMEEVVEENMEEVVEENMEDAVEENMEEVVEEENTEEVVEEEGEEVVEENTEEVVEENTEEVVEENTEEVVEEEGEEVVEEDTEEVVEEEGEEVVEEEGEEVFAVVINGIEYYTTDETNGVIFNEDLSIEIGKFENKVAKFYK